VSDEINDADTEVRFGSGRPFSLGVEEELFAVDPVTGHQANSAAAVIERLGDLSGTIAQELHACQLELITDVHLTVGEAIGSLASMRRSVGEIGAGLLGSGTHPSGLEGDAEITDKERYERIRFLLGDAIVTPVAGLHVHVGMPDAPTAIAVFNALREQLPLLQALAANSPFRHGRDTGLASAREISIRGWPRSGVPRALRDFDDFCELSTLLATAADVADYTWFWWKLRPHPRLGTVEVRGMDAQGSLQDAGAIIALTHCLARDAAESAAPTGAPPELIEEGMFRAARFGVDASLPDHDGHLRPVAELLASALRIASRHAAELGCEAQLEELPRLLERGGGAGRQRRMHELAGMDALVRDLAALTINPA
jgi:glutamate---cysteine ligase / carboxylate-amine ligase